MTEEQLKIVISAQTDQLKTGLDSAMSQLNGFKSSINKSTLAMSNSFKALGGVVAKVFTAGALLKLGKDAIEMSSNLQEVQNVVDTAFGEMSYKAEEFSKVAIKQFGMSELSAKKTSSTYMAMAKSMGLGMESASNMAIEVAKLTGDVASFYNISQDLASTKLKSIFTGETETLKDLGVVMTETNLKEFALTQGITKSYNEMTQAEKVALRYNYVMNALGDAQGDFARTQDSWANQTRILSEQWKSLLGILGNGLVQVLSPLIRALNSALSLMISFAQNISSIFGVKTENTITNVGGAIADVGGAYEEMGEQAEESGKKAKKGLMSFDEITNLQQDTGSKNKDDLGGGLGSLTTIESTTSNAIGEVADKLKDITNVDFTKLKKSLNDLKDTTKKLLDIFKPLKDAVKNAFSEWKKWLMQEGLQEATDTLSMEVDALNTTLTMMGPILSIVEGILEGFIWCMEKLDESLASVGMQRVQTILKPFETLKQVNPYVQKLTDWIEQLKEMIRQLNPDLDITRTIFDSFAKGLYNSADWRAGFIFDLIEIVETLPRAYESLGKCNEKLKEFGDWIANLYREKLPFFNDILTFLSGPFTADWGKIWDNLKTGFSNYWNGVGDLAKKGVNGIIDSVNKMIGGLESALNVIVKAINSIKIKNPFTDEDIWSPHLPTMSFSKIPKLARGGIVDGATTFIAGEHGKEAVIPLENNTEWMDKMAQKVVGMMTAVNSLNNDSVTISVPLELNGREIANATIKDLNLESIRRGYKPILNT